MLDQQYNPKLLFFDCVISDQYLFQEIALLNPCFEFPKNLLLPFIDYFKWPLGH